MKRKLTLFLSVVMAASSLPMTAYAANFKDINDVPWNGAQTVINQVADLGLLGGYEDNTFRARNNVTYCEAMQMVYKVMTNTGATELMNAVDAYSYMAVLDAYKVPKWAQMAVAYGLYHNIIDMQMVVSKFANGNQYATREDVALMFGNAMAKFYDKERSTPDALTFADYWAFSQETVAQIDLLKRLNIISGDNVNCFNPRKNINRAEMAVMLNKTNGVLTEGVSSNGEITQININNDKYYYIEVTQENGRKEGFLAEEGSFPVYEGNTANTIPLTSLSEGDKVVLIRGGNDIVALRQMDGVVAQGKYDVTGYINSFKGRELSVKNENTGEKAVYRTGSDTKIRVENKTTSQDELEELLKEHINEHAYVGIVTEAKREKVNGVYKDVLYAEQVEVFFVNEYTVVGKLSSFGQNAIQLKQTGDGSAVNAIYAADCEYYIADSRVSYDEMKKLADSGTVYVKVIIDNNDKAIKVIMSEDTFVDNNLKEESKTYTVLNINNKKLSLEYGSKTTTFNFGSENPLDNIVFYEGVKDGSEWDWEDLKDVDEAANRLDKWEDEGETVYCKVTFNKGDRLSEVYLATSKNAWKDSDTFQTDRKGTVGSVKDDILKFATSTQEYTLLKKYESDDFIIDGPVTQSKVVLERLANDDDIELYAEIKANGNGEVVKLFAEVRAAKGKLVEYKPEEYIKIETENGSTYKFNVVVEPDTDDEEEYTWKDFSRTHYIGADIELEFNGNGSVEQINLLKDNRVTKDEKVKGIATSAADGLKIEGSSKTYRWWRHKEFILDNRSTNSTTLDNIIKMIDDEDVKVYVEVKLGRNEASDRVEELAVFVREAEGTLEEYGDEYCRIKTSSGNKFSFFIGNNPDCNVDGITDLEKMEDGKADGKHVTLTFNENGALSKIEG